MGRVRVTNTNTNTDTDTDTDTGQWRRIGEVGCGEVTPDLVAERRLVGR
jgi:hypothetical protein